MSYVSSIELRKVRPEAIQYVTLASKNHLHPRTISSSEKSVIESVVDLFHDVVDKVPQVSRNTLTNLEDLDVNPPRATPPPLVPQTPTN